MPVDLRVTTTTAQVDTVLWVSGRSETFLLEFDAAVTSFEKAAEALPTWAAPQVGLGYAIFSSIKSGCPCGPEDDEKVRRITEAYQKAVELGTDEPGLKERVDALAKGEKVK